MSGHIIAAQCYQEIRWMEQKYIITPMNEASQWCALIVPVVRPGRKRVRTYVDLRKLNKNTVRDKYPLPTLDDILHKLSKSSVFSGHGRRSWFWQFSFDNANSVLNTFIAPVGRFRFKPLPVGITCSYGAECLSWTLGSSVFSVGTKDHIMQGLGNCYSGNVS